MPKLATAVAKQAASASVGFAPLEPGIYYARLTGVEAKTASTGNAMWVWAFEISRGDKTGKKQWVNTVLVENAMWKLGQVFDAFGVPTDTDTDELIGKEVRIEVSQRTIGAGQRAGQIGNNVDNVLPLDDAPATASKAGVAAGAPAGSTEDPGF